jgi:hypothetical protein
MGRRIPKAEENIITNDSELIRMTSSECSVVGA